MCRVADVMAAVPAGYSHIIHLHLPGYRPGRKRRSIADMASLCGGATVSRCELAPIRVALDTWRPTGTDPRGSWRWCHVCIGHLVMMAGIETAVLLECLAAGQIVEVSS